MPQTTRDGKHHKPPARDLCALQSSTPKAADRLHTSASSRALNLHHLQSRQSNLQPIRPKFRCLNAQPDWRQSHLLHRPLKKSQHHLSGCSTPQDRQSQSQCRVVQLMIPNPLGLRTKISQSYASLIVSRFSSKLKWLIRLVCL